MKPEYSVEFHTAEEALRFLNFHLNLAKILGISITDLYKAKTQWESKVLELIQFEHLEELEKKKEEEEKVNEEEKTEPEDNDRREETSQETSYSDSGYYGGSES